MKKNWLIIVIVLTLTVQIGVVFFAPLKSTTVFAFQLPKAMMVRSDCFTKEEQKQITDAGYVEDKQAGGDGRYGVFIHPDYISSDPGFLDSRGRKEYDKITNPQNKKAALFFAMAAKSERDERSDDWKDLVKEYVRDTGHSAQECSESIMAVTIAARRDRNQCADAGGLAWHSRENQSRLLPYPIFLTPPPTGSATCTDKGGLVKMLLSTQYQCCCTSPPKEPEKPVEVKKCGVIKLEIPIASIGKEIKLCDCDENGITTCSGIATYITAVYEWLVRLAVVLSMLIVIFAGLRLLFARGNTGTIAEVKKMITNACIGLILALGSYTLLSAINPKLTIFDIFKPTVIKGIDPITYSIKDGLRVKSNTQGVNCPHPELTKDRLE